VQSLRHSARRTPTALLALAALAWLIGAAAASAAPAPVVLDPSAAGAPTLHTGLFMDGDPGDYVHGYAAYYGPEENDFTIRNSSPLWLDLVVLPEWTILTFSTTDLGVPLVEGETYTVGGPGNPGTGTITRGQNGRGCTGIDGEFTMLEWALEPDGSVRSAAIDFRHRCATQGTDWVHGSLRINSTHPITALTLRGVPVNVGAFRTGTTAPPAFVTIDNPGSTDLPVGPFEATGTDADEVGVDASDCPAALVPGASCTIAVTVTGLRRGVLNAGLSIRDGTARGARVVAIAGVSQDPTAVTLALRRVDGYTVADLAVSPNPGAGIAEFSFDTLDRGRSTASAWLAADGTASVQFLPPLGSFSVEGRFAGNTTWEPSSPVTASGVATAATTVNFVIWNGIIPAGQSFTLDAYVWSMHPLPPGTLAIHDETGGLVASIRVPGQTTRLLVQQVALEVGVASFTASYASDDGSGDPASATQSIEVVPGGEAPEVVIEPGPLSATADVTLGLLAPNGPYGVVRISNNGVTWVERSWTAAVSWSLIDPAAGGRDEDGIKHVHVWYREAGGPWSLRATGSVTLDRVPPSLEGAQFQVNPWTWRGTVTSPAGDWAAWRTSIDGTTWSAWSAWSAGSAVDLWARPDAAAWYDGDRPAWVQVRDAAGNATEQTRLETIVLGTDIAAPAGGQGVVDVGFAFPKPAITGRPFTIRPVYPAGYQFPSDAWCKWYLDWGDDQALELGPNDSWGEISFERKASTGACNEWTFTLPYTADRQFVWWFDLYHKGSNANPGEGSPGIYTGPSRPMFKALLESTDPHIRTSSVPIAYVLPDAMGPTQAGDPVTYRLHLAGAGTLPTNGHWFASPLGCYLNPSLSKEGGLSWTYTPHCNGSWVTGWTGTMGGGWARAQYDPVVDGRAPTVSGPSTAFRGATVGTRVPVTVSWGATDRGSGVWRYEIQGSRNGSAWRDIDLPTRLTTSIIRSLATDGTYRFRVRARDRVGNWSAWRTGPTLRAGVVQESGGALSWSGAWTRVTDTAAWGGRSRQSGGAGASVRTTFTGRGIAWVAGSGPASGTARVYVDGVLAATLDLKTASDTHRRVVWRRFWGSSRTHQVRIVVAGTGIIDVDGFAVLR
jgi:hypothetical protein